MRKYRIKWLSKSVAKCKESSRTLSKCDEVGKLGSASQVSAVSRCQKSFNWCRNLHHLRRPRERLRLLFPPSLASLFMLQKRQRSAMMCCARHRCRRKLMAWGVLFGVHTGRLQPHPPSFPPFCVHCTERVESSVDILAQSSAIFS